MIGNLLALSPVELGEALLRHVGAAHDLFTVIDPEARFLYVSPNAQRVLGCSPEECRGRPAFDSIQLEDRERTRAAFDAWLADEAGKPFEFENRQLGADGGTIQLRWTITRHVDPDGHLLCLISHAHDVTHERRMAEKLGQSEGRLRALLRGMLDAVVTIDGYGTIQDVSDSVERMFGYSPRELVGQNVSMLMPEPHRSQHDGYLANYRRTGNTWILNRTRAFSVLRKDGSPIDIELSVSRIDVPGASEPLFCGSFRDVTERHRAERALAESERRIRAVFDQEFQFVGLLEPDGTVLDANETVLEAAGVRREEVVGRPFWKTPWWRAEDRERIRQGIEAAARGEFVRFETTQRTADGRALAVDFSLKPILGPDGAVEFLLPEGRDITSIKDAQRRETAMLRALAAIGESASVLAHEIKNPITAVNIALRAVADRLGEDQREILDDLVSRMQKLEKTMRRTLQFARPLKLALAPSGIREVLEAAVLTLRPECARAAVAIEIDVDPACPQLSIDRGLVEDLFVNLLRNSIEAEAHRVRLGARPGGKGFVEVRVDDDGPGVPPSQADSLFKPFVTTKAAGTGLGLAIVRKIVQEHGGSVELDASPLGGAGFVLRFPAAKS
jgi:two-component system sensor histidine kinase/response regulator